MKYIFIILFISCSHRITEPQVVFEPGIKYPKGLGKITDTVWVQTPLEVRCSWRSDTVALIPGHDAKGYTYKVAVINDTLRIVDSFPAKKAVWHEDPAWLSELHGYYVDDSGNVEILYHFLKRRDTITMLKPVNKFFDGAKYIVIDGRIYQLKNTVK